MRIAIGLLLLGAAGCGGRDLFQGGALPTGAPVYHIAVGVAVPVTPTGRAGYGATAGGGGAWRLVWLGSGAVTDHFTGSIWTAGHFTRFAPGCDGLCALESDDFVSGPRAAEGGQRIDFDTFSANSLDGVDFDVDAEPVYFDLLVDGVRDPAAVLFPAADQGDQPAPPGIIPFALAQ